MPTARVYRAGTARIATIEIELPHASHTTDDMTCPICAESFCARETCGRSPTALKCCDQPVCCTCIARVSKRCTCTSNCAAVIAYCPYCREISPVTSLDIFLGVKGGVCKECTDDASSCDAMSVAG